MNSLKIASGMGEDYVKMFEFKRILYDFFWDTLKYPNKKLNLDNIFWHFQALSWELFLLSEFEFIE